MMKDIGRLEWVNQIIKNAKAVVKFLRAHHKTLMLMRNAAKDWADDNVGKDKELLLPRDIRFHK
jgi:hypothetical protein